jgi:hypothetical protein
LKLAKHGFLVENPYQLEFLPLHTCEDCFMNRLLPALPFLFIGTPLIPAASQEDSLTKSIRLLARQGKGTAEGRAAWDKVVAKGPVALTLLLEAMQTKDTVAANWLRTAFDRITDRE